jgi:hypothetical protein
MIAVTSVKEAANIVHIVAVHALKVLGRKTHRHDAIGDVG